MPAPYKEISPEQMNDRAWAYIQECIASKKEVATNKGPVEIKERHLPTIAYFLKIWLPLHDYETYSRQHWYKIIEDPKHPLCDTIKSIDEIFIALATDIVANEGKGIFYAKNKLGMTDKIQEDGTKEITIKVKYDKRADGNTDPAA